MRGIIERYPSKKINIAADIFPLEPEEPGTGTLGTAIAKDESSSAKSEPGPIGAILTVGLVFGGLYYLAKNMGVER